ncbi:hypothetical protein PG2011B_1431 [Bifidobacterium animalis subsp. lactis]|uniref:Uncharacterized protein n=1 Tax=Bifidobacterium animalis subsp. lactis TaxID=302911 RepID=A0A8B3RGW4_BIFAN|nr:hypothetical protein PG2011B_1431 [Bifidobacterium animalis subsp. lactis]
MFPASAGMIQFEAAYPVSDNHVPRKRGDDPTVSTGVTQTWKCSPQARG